MSRARGWLVSALVAVLVGAFAVQATSTWRFGGAHHLADVARPGLILMLELGSVTGASIYVAAATWPTRRRAGLLVAIAAGVGCYGGVQTYSAVVAVPVTLVLLLMVELIRCFWAERPAAPNRAPVEPPVTVPIAAPVPTAPVPTAPVPTVPTADRPSIAAPVPTEPVPTAPVPTRLHPVPARPPTARRNRDQLEAAGKALPDDLRVIRKAGELVDSLRARVEAAEQRDRARRTTTA